MHGPSTSRVLGFSSASCAIPLLVVAACGGGEQVGSLGGDAAHEHGVARVNVAVEGANAEIELRSPAVGIYGFEHSPRTHEERRRQQEAVALLRTRAAEFLVFEEELGCTVSPVQMNIDDEEEGHHPHHGDGRAADAEVGQEMHDETSVHSHADDDGRADEEEHAQHAGGSKLRQEDAMGVPEEQLHSEVLVEYRVRCAGPLAGTRLRFAIPSTFPGIERLDVQVLSEGGQTGGRLEAVGAVTL